MIEAIKFIYRLSWLDFLFPRWRITMVCVAQGSLVHRHTGETKPMSEGIYLVRQHSWGGRKKYTVLDPQLGIQRELSSYEVKLMQQQVDSER